MQKSVFKYLWAPLLGAFISMNVFAEGHCPQDKGAVHGQQPQQEEHQQSTDNTDRLYRVDNADFELFLTAIVDAATQTGKQSVLSKVLLSCFDYLSHEQKMACLESIQREIPELMQFIALYK